MKRPQPETIFNNSDYEWISHDIQVQDPSKEYVDAILFRGITEKNLGRIVIWYESTNTYEGLEGRPYTLVDAPLCSLFDGVHGVLKDSDGDQILTRPRKSGKKRRRTLRASDVRSQVCRLQGGTGKHIDGNILNPLESRPFQALIALTDSKPMDGSLRVLPGFHAVALRYFEGRNADVPRGGYTPLQPGLDDECLEEDGLWCTAKRIPKGWIQAWKNGSFSSVPNPRTRLGIVKLLKSLHKELHSFSYDSNSDYNVQTGDYVLWDTRLAHSTGERNTFSSSSELRQAFYCSYVLQSMDESGLHKRMIQSCRDLSTSPEWAPSSSTSPFLSGFSAERLRGRIGRALYGYSSTRSRRHRRFGSSEVEEEEEKKEEPGGGGGGGGENITNLATDAHIAFFRRYGFVVIENIVSKDLARELRDAVRKEMKDRCDIDVTSLDTLKHTMTFEKLRRAYSPDGAAMVEMYWHPLMERIRQDPAVSGTFLELVRGTWGRGGGAYRLSGLKKKVDDDENLLIYIDRTNLKLPGCALENLILQETSLCASNCSNG